MDAQNSELLDLISAYALNALSPNEKAQVEALIASSEAARKEFETYQAILTGYALVTPARKAPSRLNNDFRARLATEASAAPTVTSAKPVQISRFTGRTRMILALAAVLVVAIGVTFLTRFINDPERPIRSILDNPSARIVTLSAQGNTAAKISVVMLPDQLDAVIVADLPVLPEGKQYQVWWIAPNGKAPASLGVFSAEQGTKRVLINMPKQPSKETLCGITVEPAGGSPSPTTQPIISGPLVN